MKTHKRIFTLLIAFALVVEFCFSTSIMTAYAETDESAYPAVTMSETVEGVTITLEAPEGALPEGASMTVESVDRDDVFDAVDKKFKENGRKMTDAVAFDVTPLDRTGKEIQPRKEVMVTFSGTGLDSDDSGVSVFRVSDDAKKVTEMKTSVATADEQQFVTDHFTIYVEGGSEKDQNGDGSGSNERNHAYVLPYHETAKFKSTNTSSITESWFISSNVEADSLTLVDEDEAIFKNTNEYPKDTLVEIGHTAGWGLWKERDFNYFVQPQRKRIKLRVFYQAKPGEGWTEYKEGAEERWAGEQMKFNTPNVEKYKFVQEENKLYVFDGWYTDEECTKRPNSVTSYWTKDTYPWFSNDTNLYGKYRECTDKNIIVYDGNADALTFRSTALRKKRAAH